jgi:hypothetical protein
MSGTRNYYGKCGYDSQPRSFHSARRGVVPQDVRHDPRSNEVLVPHAVRMLLGIQAAKDDRDKVQAYSIWQANSITP